MTGGQMVFGAILIFCVLFPLLVLFLYGFIFVCSGAVIAKQVKIEADKRTSEAAKKIEREIRQEVEKEKEWEQKWLEEDYQRKLEAEKEKAVKDALKKERKK